MIEDENELRDIVNDVNINYQGDSNSTTNGNVKITFENTYNIEYMTVVTEDLLNCSPSKFINAAKLQNPLNINLFGKYKDRLNCFFNNAVLYDDLFMWLDIEPFETLEKCYDFMVSYIDDLI